MKRCVVNIGTNRRNITGVKFDKPFKDVRYSDIFGVAKAFIPDGKFSIIGWADVTKNYKD